MKKSEVLTLLQSIQYPGFSRDIVSFGMVKNVNVGKDNLKIELAIKTQNDEKKKTVVDEIENKLSPYFKQVDINIITDGSHRGPSAQTSQSPVQQKFNLDQIKNVIAVASGKGGVGKSTVAANIALALKEKKYTVGLLDLDIYGPSLPITMGINQNPEVNEEKKIIPLQKNNLKLMSFGFVSGNEAPVVWRGPLVAKMTEQFFRDVYWGDLDYLILDLPPGTGDVQLTLSQKIPLDGAIIVTTPNDIALADVRKGADMFKKVETPLLGVVENMSYMSIDGNISNANDAILSINNENISINNDGSFNLRFNLFKEGGGLSESQRLEIPFLGEIPYSNDLMRSIDSGNPIVFEDTESDIKNIFIELAKKVTLL